VSIRKLLLIQNDEEKLEEEDAIRAFGNLVLKKMSANRELVIAYNFFKGEIFQQFGIGNMTINYKKENSM
jgi:hypothetical protein